jgi:hypothetical protein
MNAIETLRTSWKTAKPSDDRRFYRLPTPEDKRPDSFEGIGVPLLDEAIQRLRAKVKWDAKDAPGYEPFVDTIHLLPLECYTSPGMAAHALAHELVHWTAGATEDRSISSARVNRLRRNIKDYAREELVAELGAAMLLERFGMFDEAQFVATSSYIKSFLEHVGDFEFLGYSFPNELDDRARQQEFDKAARRAGEAVSYILGE